MCVCPQLVGRLPPRVKECVWDLVYSTEEHGTSLRTLYRQTAQIDRPVLLLIKDMYNQVHKHTYTIHTIHTLYTVHTHTHTQVNRLHQESKQFMADVSLTDVAAPC